MRRILLIFITTLLFSAILFAGSAYAQGGIDPIYRPSNLPTTSGKTTGEIRAALTSKIVKIVLGIAGAIAVFFIIYNAFFLITSGGSEEVVTQHKKGIMWAIVGLLLIILSFVIIRFVISVPFKIAPQPETETEESKKK